MAGIIKNIALFVSGFIGIALGLIFLFFLCAYVVGGAGLQVFGFFFPVVPVTIVIGVVHVIGFSAAACICFIIGLGLIALGSQPASAKKNH